MTKKLILTLTLAATSTATLLAAPVVLTGKTVTPIADGAFELAPGQSAISQKLIPVDPAKSYAISGEFRSNGKPGESPAGILYGIIPYDKNGRQISMSMVNAVKNTETELAAPAAKGAKSVIVKDASKWRTAANTFVVAFNVLPDYADLPNRQMGLMITKVAKVASGWQIDLSVPLKADYAAGTKVRQHQEGSYCWCGLRDKTFKGNEWTAVSSTISGESKSGCPDTQFWAGTRYVQIALRRSPGAKFEFRNLSFDEEK